MEKGAAGYASLPLQGSVTDPDIKRTSPHPKAQTGQRLLLVRINGDQPGSRRGAVDREHVLLQGFSFMLTHAEHRSGSIQEYFGPFPEQNLVCVEHVTLLNATGTFGAGTSEALIWQDAVSGREPRAKAPTCGEFPPSPQEDHRVKMHEVIARVRRSISSTVMNGPMRISRSDQSLNRSTSSGPAA